MVGILTFIQQEHHIQILKNVTFVQMVVDMVAHIQIIMATIEMDNPEVAVVVPVAEIPAELVEVSLETPMYQLQEHKVILVEIVDLTGKPVVVVDTLRQDLEELAAVLGVDVVEMDLIAQ